MVCLGRCSRETWIHDDQLRAALQSGDEIRDLRREDIFTDVAADQNDRFGFFKVDGFRRIDGASKGELISNIARTPALRECRLRTIRGSERLHQSAKKSRGDPVREKCHGFWPILLFQVVEPSGKQIQRLGP